AIVVPSLTAASSAGATSSWLFREMPWSFSTSLTVSPVAETWSIFPSTLRVTSLPIEAYPTVVPITAAAATATAPTRAILLFLTRAGFWRTALQPSYFPVLGWHLAAVVLARGRACRGGACGHAKGCASCERLAAPVPDLRYPIPANSHQTIRRSGNCTQNY